MRNIVVEDGNLFRFLCPHCNIEIEVEKKQTNCCIFRCGLYKSNMKQVPPHTKKPECDRLVEQNLIFGCGKPFKFFKNPPAANGNYVEECGYI